MNTDAYYRPSGKFSMPGALIMLIFGLIGACVSAVVYALLVHYVPFIYLNFCFCVGAAVVTGLAVGFGCRRAHVRNVGVCVLVALICGAVLLYVQWALYFGLSITDISKFYKAAIELMAAPALFWELIVDANNDGLWSLKGKVVKGGWLWAVWGIEALILVVGTILTGRSNANDPYSETTKQWMDEEKISADIAPVADPKALCATLEQGDFSPLQTLALSGDAPGFAKLSWHHCNGDPYAYMTLKNVTFKKNKKEEETDVFTALRVPFATAMQIVERVRALHTAPAAAPQ